MLRQLTVMIGLALAVQAVQAAEAGKIIFSAGTVQVAGKPAVLGDAVQEGDTLSTGADGYLYMKTVDDGLFILRPSSRARITTYHVDNEHPENTRVKFELLNGVARSQSGHAVKAARQNFRFNTPVAAIGVRGTDFTVFTDDNTSRVAVISGKIVVSGFVDACHPEGTGPCVGNASSELSAAQKGQLLEIRRGQLAPQLMPGGTLSPDVVSPPRSDEPLGKDSGSEPHLDAKKDQALQSQVPPAQQQQAVPPATVAPPTVPDTPVVAPVLASANPRQLSWGRWQAVYDKDANASLSKAGAERIGSYETYVLFRSNTGDPIVLPERGSVGFSLTSSEAYVRDTSTQVKTAATLDNGQLTIDFGKASFTTGFDAKFEGQTYKMASQGSVTKDGIFSSLNQFTPANNMNVTGALDGGNGAAYIFQGNLNTHKVISGATSWTK